MVTDPASMTWSSPVAGQSCAHASSLLVCRYSKPCRLSLLPQSQLRVHRAPQMTRAMRFAGSRPGVRGCLRGFALSLLPSLSFSLCLARSLSLSLLVALFLPCIYDLVLAHCYPVECLNSGQLSIALSLALCVSAPTPLCLLQLVPLEADTCHLYKPVSSLAGHRLRTVGHQSAISASTASAN